MVGVLPAPTNGESLGSGSQCIRLWGKGQDPDLQQCDPSALTLGKADMDLSYCPGRSTWSLPHTMTTGLPQSVLPRDSLMGEAVTQHSPLWTAGPGSPQTDPPEVQPPDSSCSGLDNMESSRLWGSFCSPLERVNLASKSRSGALLGSLSDLLKGLAPGSRNANQSSGPNLTRPSSRASPGHSQNQRLR